METIRDLVRNGKGSIKSFLQSIRNTRREIEYFSDMVEELRTSLLPSAIRYDKDRVQTSPEADPMTDILEKVAVYEQKIRDHLQYLLDDYNFASELIMQLERPEYRQVLHHYYLDSSRPKWAQVAEKMGYTEQRVYQIHNDAIDELDRSWRKNYMKM